VSTLDEARDFVRLHARHMGMTTAEIEAVLSRITDLDSATEGSWVFEWSRAADARRERSQTREAADLYTLARFPCADTPAKELAGRAAVATTAAWLSRTGAGERRMALIHGVTVPFLFTRPVRADAPLVVVMGGIVALKEQWSGFLTLGRRLGCAVAIADFPGVGENELPYSRGAAAVYSAIMDAVAGDCDATRTLAVAPSFGGHLALLCSVTDKRLRSLVTVGAPICGFFIDPSSRARMPGITLSALCRAARVDPADLPNLLDDLALAPVEIASITLPITYVASLRDEIIPVSDWSEAAALHPGLRVYAFDDVHGSPHYLRQIRLLTLIDLCRHAGCPLTAASLRAVVHRVLRVRPLTDGPRRR
jgi:esterase FrsA